METNFLLNCKAFLLYVNFGNKVLFFGISWFILQRQIFTVPFIPNVETIKKVGFILLNMR